MTNFKFNRFEKKHGRYYLEPPAISLTTYGIRINPRAMEILGEPRRVHVDFDKSNQAIRIMPAHENDNSAFMVTRQKWAQSRDSATSESGYVGTRLSNFMAVSKYFWAKDHRVFLRLSPAEILKLTVGYGVEETKEAPHEETSN